MFFSRAININGPSPACKIFYMYLYVCIACSRAWAINTLLHASIYIFIILFSFSPSVHKNLAYLRTINFFKSVLKKTKKLIFFFYCIQFARHVPFFFFTINWARGDMIYAYASLKKNNNNRTDSIRVAIVAVYRWYTYLHQIFITPRQNRGDVTATVSVRARSTYLDLTPRRSVTLSRQKYTYTHVYCIGVIYIMCVIQCRYMLRYSVSMTLRVIVILRRLACTRERICFFFFNFFFRTRLSSSAVYDKYT